MNDRLSPQISASEGPSPKCRRQSSTQGSAAADGPREVGQMRPHRDMGSGPADFVGSGSGIHFVWTIRHALPATAMVRDMSHSREQELQTTSSSLVRTIGWMFFPRHAVARR
ncbi:uncharacterized protein K444DRAFT_663866 [Hyaloscypha bicolor E]|uniref:Uncharacterized protein n=1 Tax=Hyaloscypha bicolor E TaxID=1095630 RepID=A0A2J6T906_9HELO|nr:uncharacterized protein K444DRAFT_663866 [Hyaloscypha bicolor E]PMD59468.1 hypothetical protein K444DRAFT_663866 [Hyaloscypha bicolor E]